jgi:hypothetical protein
VILVIGLKRFRMLRHHCIGPLMPAPKHCASHSSSVASVEYIRDSVLDTLRDIVAECRILYAWNHEAAIATGSIHWQSTKKIQWYVLDSLRSLNSFYL